MILNSRFAVAPLVSFPLISVSMAQEILDNTYNLLTGKG